jgi:Transposase IS4
MSQCHHGNHRLPKTGKLPHLSFIARKPWPFGTEFKVMACAVIGCLLYLEIQKGKYPMREAKYSDEHGCTAACSLRLAEATEKLGQPEEGGPNLLMGDSWFASVKLAEQILKRGHAFIGPVKTNHSGFPGKEIAEIMKHWPAGSSVVFEAEDANGNKLGLTALGYKYHKKSSVHFIMTSNAGSTDEGFK